MNRFGHFDIIALLIYVTLSLVYVTGQDIGDCENKLAEISRQRISQYVDLNSRTGRFCICARLGTYTWSQWSSCAPSYSCFESAQRRKILCSKGCYRIQLRRCPQRLKPSGCTGQWAPWSGECQSAVTAITRTRFCYSKSGKLGSYCNVSRDEFYQTKVESCNNMNIGERHGVPGPTNAPFYTPAVASNKSGWISTSEGNLVLIILSVLAGIFFIALIFVSIMFATLRKTILANGGSKSNRSVSESTVSAASCLTTINDSKDFSPGPASPPKYYQIKASQYRPVSNGNGTPPTRVKNKESILSTHDDVPNMADVLPSVVNSTVHRDDDKGEMMNKPPDLPERSVTENGSTKERGSGLFKKAQSKSNEKSNSKEGIVTSVDEIEMNSPSAKTEPFQSLPHVKYEDAPVPKRKSKNFRFSGGKEITKKTEDKRSRNRTQSDDEIVFSGWDPKAQEPTTNKSMQHEPSDSKNDQMKSKRPASNTFLFSSRAFNSLQKSSTASKASSKSNGFKLDQNKLMKRVVAANARGRAATDGEFPKVSVNIHGDSGNYSHIDLDMRSYGSVLDAKPIEADAISNGSAYADVWDADYTGKAASENDEDDYSEVFDARSKAKNSTSTRPFSRPNHELSNRSLPSFRSRNTVREQTTHISYHPTGSGASRSARNVELPTPTAKDNGKNKNLNDPSNEPIYCAI